MSEQRVEFKDGEFLIHTNNGTLKQDGTASVSLEGDFTISADCLRAWLAAAQNKVLVKNLQRLQIRRAIYEKDYNLRNLLLPRDKRPGGIACRGKRRGKKTRTFGRGEGISP